ncbi:hypothetical protein CBR_g34430 [Chara braunii]|uniref:Uncharacterized protein n=1 Tax=Chara braunii TaxID=69332 RepID=A0A388LIK4_CHABU|nr:hypothetical protein CBR_g34430 [Chara braunii]|eukprot:GBG82149.1 hypothetical protein CBR_g34430 [Chara braunii]
MGFGGRNNASVLKTTTWTGDFATTATRSMGSTRSTMPMDTTEALLQGIAQWLSLLQMSHDLHRQKVDEMRRVADGGNTMPYLTHQSMMQSLVHIITKLEEGPTSYLARFIDQQHATTLMRHCYTVFEEGQPLCAVSMDHWYDQLDLEEEDDSPSSPATPTQVAGCPCIGINRNNNNNNNNNNINNNDNNGNIVAAAAGPFHGDSDDNGNIIAAAAGRFDGDSGEIGSIINHDNTNNNNTDSVVVDVISRSCVDERGSNNNNNNNDDNNKNNNNVNNNINAIAEAASFGNEDFDTGEIGGTISYNNNNNTDDDNDNNKSNYKTRVIH